MNFPAGFDRNAWKAAPHTAWALRNADRFLPVVPVPRAECPMPLAVREEGHEPADYPAAVSATSAIMLREGEIVFEHYAGDCRPEERHMTFSITKSILGLVALGLIHEGSLDPAIVVQACVPELAGTVFGTARLSELLAMRDGAPFDENYADPLAQVHAYSQSYWGTRKGGTLAALGTLTHGRRQPGRFAYRTPVADVVGWVLMRATGRSLAELVSDRVWKPIGAEADAAMVLDTAGQPIGGTGLIARPRDLARLAIALTDDRSGAVARPVRDALFAGGDPAAFAAAGYATRRGWSYQGLWWHLGGERIAALGVHGQRLIVDRPSRAALVITGAADLADTRAADPLHMAAMDALCRRAH